MAWQTPKTDWQSADPLTKDDMNRIEGNTEYLKNTTDDHESRIVTIENNYADKNLSNVLDSIILDKLKNVDGEGSGLDADLVRGIAPPNIPVDWSVIQNKPFAYVDVTVTNLVNPFTQDSNSDGLADGWTYYFDEPATFEVDTVNRIQHVSLSNVTYVYDTGKSAGYISSNTLGDVKGQVLFGRVLVKIIPTYSTSRPDVGDADITFRDGEGRLGATNAIYKKIWLPNTLLSFTTSGYDSWTEAVVVAGCRNSSMEFSLGIRWSDNLSFDALDYYWKDPIVVNLTALGELPQELQSALKIKYWVQLPLLELRKIFSSPFSGTITLRVYFTKNTIIGSEIVE